MLGVEFLCTNDKKIDFYQKLLCSKSIDWAYEQEERVFMALMDLNSSSKNDPISNDPVVLYDIPPDSITEIYIGARATESTKSIILDAIKLNRINCRIFTTKFSLYEYKIDTSEVFVQG